MPDKKPRKKAKDGAKRELNTSRKRQKKTSKREMNTLALPRLIVTGALVLTACILVVMNYAIYKIKVLDAKQEHLAQLTEDRAKLTVQNLRVELERQRGLLLKQVIREDPAEALQNADDNALAKISKEVKKRVPGLISLRFFALESAQIDRDIFPPIRFAELDMIRRAETRQNILPEAARLEKSWYWSTAFAIPTDPKKEIVGTAMATFTVDSLKKAMVRSNHDLGVVQLKQSFGGGSDTVILRHGSSEIADGVSSPIPDSHWLVEFAPTQVLMDKAYVSMPMIILSMVTYSIGIGAALIAVGLILSRKVQANNLRRASSPVTALKNQVDSAASARAKEDRVMESGLGAHSVDILDIDIAQEDEALLGLDNPEPAATPKKKKPASQTMSEIPDLEIDDAIIDDKSVPKNIFRAYDIRGVYEKELSLSLAEKIGKGLGSEALDQGQTALYIARDARTHSPQITEFLVRGILSTGCNVIGLGTVPTPLLYFATQQLQKTQSGVMVTASHNDAQYNGFKVVMNGECRSGEDIEALRTRIVRSDFRRGDGKESNQEVIPEYNSTVVADIALAGNISIVVDCANAVTSVVAPQMFEEMGCQVHRLNADLDGSFPKHAPDPSREENLQELIAEVQSKDADLGIAFDGDGDRLAVVTKSGEIIWPDRLLMLFAKEILTRNPGVDVVFDVKSTRHLSSCIADLGGRPVMWKTGHAPMKEKMIETGAVVGAEYSGHFFFKDRWFGFDDGMYAAARLLEIVTLSGKTLEELLSEFPSSVSTPEIRIPVAEERKFEIVEALKAQGDFGSAKLTLLDGVRADFPRGWGLVRASNTEASLTMRFEADSEHLLHKLQSLFVRELRKIDNSIQMEVVENSETKAKSA